MRLRIIKRRSCPSVKQSVYTLTLKEANSFEIWYRDIGEGFREDLEAIFLKSIQNPNFLERFKEIFFYFILVQTVLLFPDSQSLRGT